MNNPLTDSRRYEVKFLDGTTEVIAANVIAEKLLVQIDEEGHRKLMMDKIIDHRKDPEVAISKENSICVTQHGRRRVKRMTKGWDICVQWKDGSTSWITLKDIKNSYPVKLAEYAISNGIDDEPAFLWWVKYTMKKRTAILSKLKSKYWQRTHKYGIRIPKTVEEAINIDRENWNDLRRKAIEEEMKRIRDTFELYEGDTRKLVEH